MPIRADGNDADTKQLIMISPRYYRRLAAALFVFVNGFITIAILAALGMITQVPFVFPSLGPTAFGLFFSPNSPASRPRNVILGHAIGILCGYGSLWAVGLQDAPSVMLEGIEFHRVLAAGLSLALTGALMILAGTVHAPAGATTLIISLGIITTPFHLLIIEVAVVLMVLQAAVVNRWEAGIKQCPPASSPRDR